MTIREYCPKTHRILDKSSVRVCAIELATKYIRHELARRKQMIVARFEKLAYLVDVVMLRDACVDRRERHADDAGVGDFRCVRLVFREDCLSWPSMLMKLGKIGDVRFLFISTCSLLHTQCLFSTSRLQRLARGITFVSLLLCKQLETTKSTTCVWRTKEIR